MLDFDSIYDETYALIRGKQWDGEKARNLFNQLHFGALSGNAKCQHALSSLYGIGYGCEKNIEQSNYWIKRAADQEFLPSIASLGDRFLAGDFGINNDIKAFNLYQKACANGYIKASYSLAKCYIKGKGVEKNPKLGLEILESASLCNNGTAHSYLGIIYLNGEIVEKDIDKALYYFFKGKETNDRLAYRCLGFCYKNGIGVEKNIEASIDNFTNAGFFNDKFSIKKLIELFNSKENQKFLDQAQFDLFVKALYFGLIKIEDIVNINFSWELSHIKDEVIYNRNKTILLGTRSHIIPNSDEIHKNVISHNIIKGTRYINKRAFRECNEIKSIFIPDSVNFIDSEAFQYCPKLKSITLPKNLLYIGDQAFQRKGNNILWGREYEKERLKISLPQYLQFIDGNPFGYDCKLENLSDNFKLIEDVLFSSDGKTLISFCSEKDEYAVPEGVEKIGKGAFRNTPIKTIILPETLKIIEKEAFESSLITNIVLPESLEEIHEKAFNWCNFGNGCITLPSNLKLIDPEAFEFDWYIKLIKIPKGMMEHYKSLIDDWAWHLLVEEDVVSENGLFFNLEKTKILSAFDAGKDIIIPEGVNTIKEGTFFGIYTIETIRLPKTLTILSDEIFDEEGIPNKILVPKGTKKFFIEKLPNCKDVIEEN